MHPERLLTPALDPPPGGLDGLRDRLQRRNRRRRGLVGGAVMALIIVPLVLPPPSPPISFASDHPLNRVTADAPKEPVRIVNGTAVEWKSTTPNTRIYLVNANQRPTDLAR
jgi:hypothetical protein